MKKFSIIFSVSCLVLLTIFFLFPINLFDGEIVFEMNNIQFKEKAKLSLSYFIGIGANQEALKDVKDFYLLPMGYFFVFLFTILLPAIIAYRFTFLKPK